MPLARIAAALLVLTAFFWIVVLYAVDHEPTVTRNAPGAFAGNGRHRAEPDAG